MTLAVVTGATGFLAGALVQALLQRGYRVRGTVRSLSADRTQQLLAALAPAAALELVEGDLLQPSEVLERILEGAEILFHVASPFVIDVKDAEKELIEPALAGTRNIMTAAARCKSKGLRRVVLTSSMAAVHDCHQTQEPKRPELGYSHEDWNETSTIEGSPGGPPEAYWVSKVQAEKEAWRIAQESGLQLVTILPNFVMGPVLTPSGAQTSLSAGFLKGFIEAGDGDEPKSGEWLFSDVRDVVEAHVKAAEVEAAAGQRYVVSASTPLSAKDVTDALKSALPKAKILDGRPQTASSSARPVDSSRAPRELGYTPHTPQQSVSDMALQLVSLGVATPHVHL